MDILLPVFACRDAMQREGERQERDGDYKQPTAGATMGRFQALVPQAKTIAMSVQPFNLVALPIDEDVECAAEWIKLQFLFDQRTQAAT